jgi:hypothetical protein
MSKGVKKSDITINEKINLINDHNEFDNISIKKNTILPSNITSGGLLDEWNFKFF